MKTLIRNFSHTFRRFFTASVLNLIGLSIAFASFFVIMTQVNYDANFNKGYKDYRNIFRVEIDGGDQRGYITWTARPLGELFETVSPHVKAVAILYSWQSEQNLIVDENKFTEAYVGGFGNYLDVFQPEMVVGSADALKVKYNILIPASMARRMFGTVDAVGKTVRTPNGLALTVGGVYKDFPENSQYANVIFGANDDNENKGNWNNWNYVCFIRLDSPEATPEVLKLMMKKLKEMDNEMVNDDSFMRLTPLADIHFSTVNNKSASSHTTVYLLVCVSFLIVIIAAINYMNFSLAETPMRIRSINTQKVLGANVTSLRLSLIAETVIVCVIAFGLSLLWLLLLKDNGLQELVESDLSLGKHPLLLGITFLIAIVMGILAGIYPSYYVTSFPPALALKGSFGLSPKGRALRTGLVCLQFMVSFALIISIGIMYLQSNYIRTSDYGYDKNEILVGNANNDIIKQKSAVISELKSLSGVEDVSFSQFVLSSADEYQTWGRDKGGQYMSFSCMPVDYNYLHTMGIHITEGRDFKEGERDVYIFNEAARKKYPWLRIDEAPFDGGGTVVGFCDNLKFTSFRNNDNEQPLAFTIYKGSSWEYFSTINVRTAKGVDKLRILHDLQKAMGKFSPGADCNFRFMDKVLDDTYQREQRFTHQILLFSFIAILISMIGVFGLTMFESEYRRKEIGIRKIMGSSTSAILYMFNKRYLLILSVCFVVAAPAGWWIGHHWLQGFAERTVIPAWLFLVAFLLVSLITMLTVTFQSWKNANENPVKSIKSE